MFDGKLVVVSPDFGVVEDGGYADEARATTNKSPRRRYFVEAFNGFTKLSSISDDLFGIGASKTGAVNDNVADFIEGFGEEFGRLHFFLRLCDGGDVGGGFL